MVQHSGLYVTGSLQVSLFVGTRNVGKAMAYGAGRSTLPTWRMDPRKTHSLNYVRKLMIPYMM